MLNQRLAKLAESIPTSHSELGALHKLSEFLWLKSKCQVLPELMEDTMKYSYSIYLECLGKLRVVKEDYQEFDTIEGALREGIDEAIKWLYEGRPIEDQDGKTFLYEEFKESFGL